MVSGDTSPQTRFFSQFKLWAKKQVKKSPSPAVTCTGRETGIGSHQPHRDQPLALPVASRPAHHPGFEGDQRATIYRVTMIKLRQKSTPLSAMVHLKNLMLQLERSGTVWRRPPYRKVKPLLSFDDDEISPSSQKPPHIHANYHGKAIAV